MKNNILFCQALGFSTAQSQEIKDALRYSQDNIPEPQGLEL
jgi:hypothetical protein